MSGLIPLLLPSSTGNKSNINPTETSRRASLVPSSSSSPSPSPPSSIIHRRQQSLPAIKTAKRGSIFQPTALPIIPFTPIEWRNAIDEVKRKYVNHKYRACSARCCEIIDNIKDTSTVEPLHLIYLHFYAASSFELCARPLSCSSTYRTRLLRDAQIHYGKADVLIQSTEETITRKTRSTSSCSTTSSLHSPGLSPSVRSSVSSTTFSSPRTSMCSTGDEAAVKPSSKPKIKAKKKVSFSGLTDLIEFQPEPYIRPDSPTLGWEDDIFPHNTDGPPLFSADKVKSAPLSKSESKEPEQPSETEPKVPEPPVPHDSPPAEEMSIVDDRFDLDAFLQTRSMNRMCAQLSALRAQVSWHRGEVQALLAEPNDTPETPALSEDASPASSLPPGGMRLIRASTLPVEVGSDPGSSQTSPPWTAPGNRDRFCDSPTPDSPRIISRPASATSTIRCTDEALKQRIERLRANGWQRKRFDSRRYEALREQVLGELA
ncbi:hypothetical protein F5Y11DRAFT_338266 [Daldinia sp. FL1419]|nr:hypothetical protein F5Y11DRAFT_338266 [Daldinia sp. FL1419]